MEDASASAPGAIGRPATAATPPGATQRLEDSEMIGLPEEAGAFPPTVFTGHDQLNFG